MKQFEITLSKEAGIYTKTIYINAEDEEKARDLALEQCNNKEHEKWEYQESYFGDPFIQVEDCEEVQS